MTAMIDLPRRRPARGMRCGRLSLATALLLATSALVPPAAAQEALAPGEAVATRFSGTIEITLGDGRRLSLIDEDGVVASAIDIRRPGFRADGRHFLNEPQHMPVTAGQVGQVFGIAIDDASPPNVYLTATSAFGLHRFEDGSDWLPGQWGEGGPGGIYVLRADNGYVPELFSTVTLDGRENSGPGLGNIAFDAGSNQFFVSDLETGMIHRLAGDGTEIDRFDHGLDGRIAFTDAMTGAPLELTGIAFDPNSGAQLEGCTDAAGAEAEFSQTPYCWNLADLRRRVWGLSAHSDPVSGQTRLYYGVSGADGLSEEGWASAGDDARNSVWSIGLNEDGSFNDADVRREFMLPDFGGGAATPRVVSDLSISPEGAMLVAERGGQRNLGLGASQPFSTPHASRVLRYVESENGRWMPDGRYDVGFNDRKKLGPPFIRSNAAGGADFGYAYDPAGAIDPAKPFGFVWMSGDSLCSPDGPCLDPATGARSDVSEVHGIQGTPVEATVELLPPGANGPTPPSGDPYPPSGPLASYMIDLDRNVNDAGAPIRLESLKHDATTIGDVAVYKVVGGDQPPAAPRPQGYDLDIDKSGPARCLPGTECSFTIRLTNNGPDPFAGPVYLWDVVQPFSAPLVGAVGVGWACFDLGSGIQCYNPEVKLGTGQVAEFGLRVRIPAGYGSDILTNCIGIQWLYDDDGAFDPLAIQIALSLLGYDLGTVDGVFGQKSRNALAQFQQENGLAPTGEIDQETAALLYPGLIGIAGDRDGSNDLDCHDVRTGDPTPVHTKWNSHLKVGSPHNKVQSHLKVGSPHNKYQSHLKIGSPHDKYQSHFKIGSPHDKYQSHFKIGSPHDKYQSHFKIGSPHDKRQSHLKIGSPHDKRQSHLKIGSPHDKRQSHLKIGSPHDKQQSHLKIGSPHDKQQSHLKIGSPHDKRQSHLKIGSPHDKQQSHLKAGSIVNPVPIHTKDQSHLKTGSPHNKVQSHLKVGSVVNPGPVHTKDQSHLKTGSPHNKNQSHLKTGSAVNPGPVHKKEQSHLKTGSPHNKNQSHLKTGSAANPGPVHTKDQSHLKTGSPHNKNQSHLKTGSAVNPQPAHKKEQSHLKSGSPHDKNQSHKKKGSNAEKPKEHSKVESHIGSVILQQTPKGPQPGVPLQPARP